MQEEKPMTANASDRKRMRIAFSLNVAMFLTGMAGWYLADSAALLADAFDMLADASGYLIVWFAIGRGLQFQRHAARWNGAMLVLLGLGVFVEVAHRYFAGSQPHGLLILAFACLSLAVNGAVLRMLRPYRTSEEVHLRATWVDTRADVLVNLSVLVSGGLIAVTGLRQIDWIVGLLIGIYVIYEGIEIMQDAGK